MIDGEFSRGGTTTSQRSCHSIDTGDGGGQLITHSCCSGGIRTSPSISSTINRSGCHSCRCILTNDIVARDGERQSVIYIYRIRCSLCGDTAHRSINLSSETKSASHRHIECNHTHVFARDFNAIHIPAVDRIVQIQSHTCCLDGCGNLAAHTNGTTHNLDMDIRSSRKVFDFFFITHLDAICTVSYFQSNLMIGGIRKQSRRNKGEDRASSNRIFLVQPHDMSDCGGIACNHSCQSNLVIFANLGVARDVCKYSTCCSSTGCCSRSDHDIVHVRLEAVRGARQSKNSPNMVSTLIRGGKFGQKLICRIGDNKW